MIEKRVFRGSSLFNSLGNSWDSVNHHLKMMYKSWRSLASVAQLRIGKVWKIIMSRLYPTLIFVIVLCHGQAESNQGRNNNWNLQVVSYVNDYGRSIKQALMAGHRMMKNTQTLDNFEDFSQKLANYTNNLKGDVSSLLEDSELFGEIDEQEAQLALARISSDLDVHVADEDDALRRLVLLALDMLVEIEAWASNMQSVAEQEANSILDVINKYR